ncbi:acyl-CoA dehydrogenase family protein [Pseudomonas sp. RIT-PI-AD]|uniref:acyl-CoA dehydrogenase family protein n=1 Tax=Pseudomonas sp. RIT-PI-AD TaxID=3035294 RepID=UPI0021DA240C|nr:acyl-CoA dehydrogenase family protein [Pseudomonas sp. RIT-PI-AD]
MLNSSLGQWLDAQADHLDCGDCDAEPVLARLAAADALGLGVDKGLRGDAGGVVEALEGIAEVAGHSLTAAFVFWGQRAFIEYLLQSDNAALRERLLPDLLAGRLAGATGLSNAMKYLSGIEALGLEAESHAQGWRLKGRLPWVTNLRKSGFVVAAAIDLPGRGPFVAALPGELPGLERSEDLALLGLQSSNTAALDIRDASLGREWLLAEDARRYLPQVRPAFLGLQCGMSIGLARRALREVEAHLGGSRSVLRAERAALVDDLRQAGKRLEEGLVAGRFGTRPADLFGLRIRLAEIVAAAVQLELQASGGKAYLQAHGGGFARRWRESAFVPVVTPSLVQLRTELARQAGEDAA